MDLLLYHLLGEEILVPYYTRTYETLNGEDIVIKRVTKNGSTSTLINNMSKIVTKNLYASNGYLNVINTVLTPASISNNIVDIALGAEDLSTLVTALGAADLVDTLDGEGPFTVFGKRMFFSSSISFTFYLLLMLYSILIFCPHFYLLHLYEQPRPTTHLRHCP